MNDVGMNYIMPPVRRAAAPRLAVTYDERRLVCSDAWRDDAVAAALARGGIPHIGKAVDAAYRHTDVLEAAGDIAMNEHTQCETGMTLSARLTNRLELWYALQTLTRRQYAAYIACVMGYVIVSGAPRRLAPVWVPPARGEDGYYSPRYLTATECAAHMQCTASAVASHVGDAREQLLCWLIESRKMNLE